MEDRNEQDKTTQGKQNKEIDEIKAHFRQSLNSHGYGFQYSVLKLAANLVDQGKSTWGLVAAEFPVAVNGVNTHIDFILKNLSYRSDNSTTFFISECKRANPALSNWCFIKAPYIRRNRYPQDPFLFEFMQINSNSPTWISSISRHKQEDSYHIAMEIRSKEKGDPCSKGRGAIEEAAAQVCRGLGGFLEMIAKNRNLVGSSTAIHFIPVIFTTAKLFTSDINLSESDLLTGNINLEKMDLIEKPFLFYQYHLSPALKHSIEPTNAGRDDIGLVLEFDYARTIFVVSASGIEQFLQWSTHYEF